MIIFNPTGPLDIASDASDLDQGGQGNTIQSGALTRCKNMRVSRKGMAETRHGSAIINASAIETPIYLITEMAGDRYEFAGTQIYQDEVSIDTGLTSAQWSAIKYNAFNDSVQSLFALNGTDRKRIANGVVYEWGLAEPAAPSVGVGAVTGLTGAYTYKITEARYDGAVLIAESNPSGVSDAFTASNQSIRIEWTTPTDPQVTHVHVYRTVAGGAEWFFVASVAVASYSYDDSTLDADLGDELAIDHDRPPLGTIVAGPDFNGYCFMAVGNLLYFCKAKQPEYWPTDYYIEVGPPQNPIKALQIFNGQLYVLSQSEIYAVQGTGFDSFFPVPLSALCGTRGSQSVAAVIGQGIFHLGRDGVYVYTGAIDKNLTDSRFRPIFEGQTVNGVPGVNLNALSSCWMQVYGSRIYFGYPSASATTPDSVLVLELDTANSAYYDYPASFSTVGQDETNDLLLAGDTSGYVHKIEDVSLTTDNGSVIAWEIASKEFTLPTRAHFPRWNKYDVDASSATTAYGRTNLDGVLFFSHNLNGYVRKKSKTRRLFPEGNGARLQIGLDGTGPVTVHMVESE